MADWANVRVKANASDFDLLRSKILAHPGKVAKDVYYPALRRISQAGVDYMRYIILTSETATGKARAGRGGNGPGRVDTGAMFDAVKMRVRERKDGFTSFVGWIDGRPGYSVFQEHGVKGGVVGMNALAQAQEFMLSEIRKLAKGGSATGNDVTFGG